MDNPYDEICDSQLFTEYVGFLDSCFDNTFALQTSLCAVKEYTNEFSESYSQKKDHKSSKNSNYPVLHKNVPEPTSSNVSAVGLSQNIKVENNKLRDWGLPKEIADKYESRGITDMFAWQMKCLSNSRVLLDGCNLVYSAPTSAGKTLVAEILTIKTILERQKKVIIILPFVSIVREKTFYLQDILTSSGIRVEGFMGSLSPPGGLQAVHVAVCTIEKANSLVNKLLDEGTIWDLGAVIVDELHLLGDPNRGYILELLLTKIKYISSKMDNVHIQIIGMSATLPNLEVLASWLGAELFITQYRPIPLDEYCLVGNKFFDKDGKDITISGIELTNSEGDNVLKICLDTIKEGCSVLIFCMTKNRCESLAQAMASSFYKLGCEGCETGLMLRDQLNSENIMETLEQLKSCPVALDDILKKTISFGVAYHHAGLTYDERDIIEGAFKRGAIRVLVATSTLSSGVNLPARRVIIRSPVFQRQPINILTYKQMIGRAGRMGKDTKGESVLICTDAEKKIGFELMMGALKPVHSCIESEDKYMRAVLEMIASQVLCTKEELELYAKCTLLHAQQVNSATQNFLLDNTLEELKTFELVRIQVDGEEKRYIATPLGKACLSSSMAPNDGLSLFCELQKARQCLVLETDLHLIYLVTPYSVSSQWGDIDWLHLLTLWESLTKAMRRVGELVGVQESFIVKCLKGINRVKTDHPKINIHKRFYTALALQDLVNEVPLSEVSTKFQCARGFLQSLQQAAATFAGMVTAFCHQLGWKNLEMLVSQFQDRLHFGIHSELIELMKLPSLNGARARTLFDAGYETIATIASADVNVIENILHKSVPFQSEKEREGDDIDDVRKRNKIKNVWITGCCGMTTREAAENLIMEARKYLQLEIGVTEIKWNNTITSKHIEGNSLQEKSKTTLHKDIQSADLVAHQGHQDITAKTYISESIKQENNIDNTDNVKNNCNVLDLRKTVKKEETFPLEYNKVPEVYNSKNIETVVKVSTPSLPSSAQSNDNSPLILKNDIVWDSLNFTDVAIENVSKMRNTDKMYSPNISFGESDQSMMSFRLSSNISPSNQSSVKDISLFSSEGENVSLFDESLPIDLIPSTLLDDKNQPTQCKKLEKVLENDTVNTNSILKGFESPLICISEDEDDIKLVYEEDDNILDSSCLSKSKAIEVVDTKELEKPIRKNSFKSPFKRQQIYRDLLQPLSKKKKKDCKYNNDLNVSNSITPKMNCDKSKKVKIQINDVIIDCFILQSDDIVNNLHIIERSKEVAIYINGKSTILPNTKIIGSSVLGVSKNTIDVESTHNLNSVKGMAFYISECTCIYTDMNSLNGTLSTMATRFKTWLNMKMLNLKVLSLKTSYLQIKRWLGIEVLLTVEDISLIEWLIDSDEKVPTIAYLMKKYCNVDLTTIPIKVNNQGRKFKFLDEFEDACIKAWAIWMVSKNQSKYVVDNVLDFHNTSDIEMKVSRILADCEFYGLTVDKDLASRLLIDVRNSQDILQKKAYQLCGYNFNFNSSKDVAKALGMYKGRRVSTKKSVLSSHNTLLSRIIIYWRKLNSILTKTLYPLTEKACIYTEGNRINPTYTTFTCTGRVSMHEPNLQNVPRTFSIPAEFLTTSSGKGDAGIIEFNCRNIFRAAPGYVMVSADYCQLEMRILTHFSEDPVLMSIMSSDLDVFKAIAASWGNIPQREVDDDLRQKAKQLCYGILYGMGNKTLAQHLDVSEIEAAMFMDSFYKTYPTVKAFTQRVIDGCRAKGYVETLTKRRRYLPDINSSVGAKKSAAERQAVNTTIQGSAADIAKTAMCAIDTRTECEPKPRLILQMHDELIYEVPETDKQTFIHTLREVMEHTIKLKVPLPVKVKCGYTWGSLEEVKI